MDQLFREEVLRHRNERLHGEVIIAQPVAHAVLTLLIVLAVSVAVAFLLSNDYTRREYVPGYLVPTKGIVAIYPAQPGLLTELYVGEDDVVKQGQQLFRVRIDQRSNSGHYVSQDHLLELQSQKARLADGIALENRNLAALLKGQDNAIAQLRAEIAALEALLAGQHRLQQLAGVALDRAGELLRRGALARTDMDIVEKNWLDAGQQLRNLELNLGNKRFELSQALIGHDTYVIDNSRSIADIENRLSEINRQIAATEVEQYNIIRAPVAGTVTSLIPSMGQRVDVHQQVLALLPANSQLEAHLYIPTRAIGFVARGQTINLRYEAFPYQRFGLYKGMIAQVSQTVLTRNEIPLPLAGSEPAYKVVAALDSQHANAYGAAVPLKPGMLLAADIELDGRSLFEWLLEPLYSLRGKL